MIDHKRHEETFKDAMEAKKQLSEIILAREPLDYFQVAQLRETYFTNLDEHNELSRAWQAERDAESRRIQQIRIARRVEAEALSKNDLAAKIGVESKRHTREHLIDLYATMKG